MKTSFPSRAAGPALFLALALAVSAQPSTPPPPGQPAPAEDADDAPSIHAGGTRSQVMSGNRIEADERIDGDVRAVMGSNWVAGTVSHDVVAIMGSDTIDGTVGDDVVAVMGSVTVNGTVGHNVKAVNGNVTLGPNAIVKGDVIAVNGTVQRSTGAVVRGRIISQPFGPHGSPSMSWRHDHGAYDWAEVFHTYYKNWLWAVTLVSLGLYALLALLFPRSVLQCGDALAQRPGTVVLASLAAVLAVPLLFVLLLVTIIGIPVALVLLPCVLLACALVGKAGIYGLVGRSLVRDRLPLAGAVLLGGVVCLLVHFVPVLGLLVALFLSILGFGCGITALLTASRRTAPPMPPPEVSVPVPPPPPAVPAEAPPPQAFSAPAAAAAAAPDPVTSLSAALPRAGFWIRMVALAIDSLIIGAIFGDAVINSHVIHEGLHFAGSNCLLPLGIYGALMWKFKGTTIGGMICGLRVVRLDGKPVEWETAIVRALGCFLSAILGLGFFWIAFDAEKQGWHDKIAGTVVVRTKGVSLV
jgi:uncharacterized RDD family membrane protein YckC